MNILAVDTSTPYTILAHCNYNGSWKVKSIHIEKVEKDNDNWLETQISEFTKNYPLENFDGFAAGYGPGSFTGLRIGFTYLKTIAVLWNKIFFSFSTSALLNSVFLNPGEILLIQLNATLYAADDNDIHPLEYWLEKYAGEKENLRFWNFYSMKSEFPPGLIQLNPEITSPADKISLKLPDPEFLSENKVKLQNELPRYGLNVELKRKNYA